MPFQRWPADALHRLAQAARVLRFAAGGTLVSVGEPLHSVLLIVQGHVATRSSTADGRQFSFVLESRPWVFGLAPMLDGKGFANDVLAVDAVTALAIPFGAIRAVLAMHPDLWQSMAEEMTWRYRYATEALDRILFDPAPVRLARALLQLVTSHGKVTPQGVAIDLRLSHERVGELLGLTRQSALQLVHAFKAHGLVAWRYGRATVTDLPGLQAAAAFGLPRQTPAGASRRRSSTAAT